MKLSNIKTLIGAQSEQHLSSLIGAQSEAGNDQRWGLRTDLGIGVLKALELLTLMMMRATPVFPLRLHS